MNPPRHGSVRASLRSRIGRAELARPHDTPTQQTYVCHRTASYRRVHRRPNTDDAGPPLAVAVISGKNTRRASVKSQPKPVSTINRSRCQPSTEGTHHIGWGGRTRTFEWRIQSPLPYHLATPQRHHDPNRRHPRRTSLARLRPRRRQPVSPPAPSHAAATSRQSPREMLPGPRASGYAPPRRTRGTPSPAASTRPAAPTRH